MTWEMAVNLSYQEEMMRRMLSAFTAFNVLWVLSAIPASAQSAFPKSLQGAWCGVLDQYGRVDIEARAWEEGDGRCTLRQLRTLRNGNIEATLLCGSGDEGRKPQQVVELYSAISLNGSPHLIRLGSMYDRHALTLYGRKCS